MSRLAVRDKLWSSRPLVAPSMLKCDFGNLHREVALLESARADMLHWDVMDGHFVPNLTYGAPVIGRVRDRTRLPFDAHLMISEPQRYWRDFQQAGCELITIHIEAVPEPGALLEQMRDAGLLTGLALNPGTGCEAVEPYLELCDLLLVMSVEPGFGGQTFIETTLGKIRRLAKILPAETLLAVDGGIGRSTGARAAAAGANVLVAGSAIFDASDYEQAISELRQQAGDSSNALARNRLRNEEDERR